MVDSVLEDLMVNDGYWRYDAAVRAMISKRETIGFGVCEVPF